MSIYPNYTTDSHFYPCQALVYPYTNGSLYPSATLPPYVVQDVNDEYYPNVASKVGQIPYNLPGVTQEYYYKEIWAAPTHDANFEYVGGTINSKTYNKNKWETLVVLNGQAIKCWENVYSTNPESVYTRMNATPGWSGVVNNYADKKINGSYPSSSQPGIFGSGIDGPYPDIEITTPGSVDLKIYLFNHHYSTGANCSIANIDIIASNITNKEKALSMKDFSFNVYQKAVTVTRKDSPTGQILTNGIDLNDASVFGSIVVGPTIYVLDKTSNRGKDITNTWELKKLDSGNGNWNNIMPNTGAGIDFNSGENLFSDTIHITFTDSGEYQIINKCSGSAGGEQNYDSDTHHVNVGDLIPLVPIIVWPNIITQVSESPFDTDLVENLNPLTSKEPFIIRTQAIVDIGTGSWIWHDPNPPYPPDYLRTMTIQDWINEIDNKCNLYCIIKKDNINVEVRTGWGPHDIELSAGTYTVQFIAVYKSQQIQIQSQAFM
jgi:hypothetical protein